MKTFRLSMIALVLLGALSCKKDASTSSSLTSDQAADMTASAIASNSGGISSMADDISANAAAVTTTSAGASTGTKTVNAIGVSSVKQVCGTTLSDSATFSGTSSSVTFNYFAKYTHTLNCTGDDTPDNIVNTLTYNGTFDGPRISTTATGTATATITGLTQSATTFVINGDYKRQGTFQSKIGNKASGNSTLDVQITSLTLNKPARTIASGSGTFTLSGTAGKVNYNFTGTITFNGDGTATLSVTGGSSYTITLLTGAWVQR